MNPRSLAYRTDLIFAGFDGEVTDHGDHLSIRTPSNPTFYWGNFLLFHAPPREGDFERWRELFTREIGGPPEYGHLAFGIDTTENDTGVVQPFLDAGFRIQHNGVLKVTHPPTPPHAATEMQIRPFRSAEDWAQLVENAVLCRDGGYTPDETRRFSRGQAARYQGMIAAGMGQWYGAFLGDRLAADLGLFQKNRLGRYQSVQTHPDFRRRGIAGTLLCAAAADAFARHNLETLVIVSEAGTPADRLYRAVGFEPTEEQMGLIKRG